VWFAWVFFLGAVILLAIKFGIGLEDRGRFGPYGDLNKLSQYGPHIILSLFPKFSIMGFIGVPILWKASKIKGRMVLCFSLAVFGACALLSGTRGWVVYPVVLMLAGAYMFRENDSRRFEAGLLVAFVLGAVVTVVVLAYRDSPAYKNSSALDFKARLLAAKILFVPKTENSGKKQLYSYGTAFSLFGYEDAMVYGYTPKKIPHAGWSGFSAIPLTWIPTYFYRDKPPLLDGEWVAGSYKDPPIQMVGHQVSLMADAYRRFGWAGISPVVFLAFAFYGALSRWLLNLWRNGSLFGWAAMMFAFMFFWSRPFSTILTTWWVFFYDTPKHVVMLSILCWIISKASSKRIEQLC